MSNLWIATREHLRHIGDHFWRSPDLTFYSILLAGASLTDASPIESVVAYELPETNGYTRQLIVQPTVTTYDVAQGRAEVPRMRSEFTAVGGSLTYNTWVILSGANPKANVLFDGVTNLVNPTTDTFTCPSHGLTQDEPVVLTAEPGSTLPAPFNLPENLDRKVYANVLSSSSFQLCFVAGGSAIDITSAGSGNFRMRYAKGKVEIYSPYASPGSIPDGRTHEFGLDYNIGYGNSADVEAP